VVGGKKGGFAPDLYAGGWVSLPLAKEFSRVVSVDANLASTQRLRGERKDCGVEVVSENEQGRVFEEIYGAADFVGWIRRGEGLA